MDVCLERKQCSVTTAVVTFVWPLIQGCAFLDLTPRTIHIPLKGALSHQNIRVNVPSTFTVAIGVTPDIMNNAAVRILELGKRD